MTEPLLNFPREQKISIHYEENLDLNVKVDMPEKKMWAVVLYIAIYDYQRTVVQKLPCYDPKQSYYVRNIEWWFKSNSFDIGSFCWICDKLAVDDAQWLIEEIRNRLKALGENPLRPYKAK